MNRPEVIEKPRQSAAALWNLSFGFLGIQVGFALQTANMSRIFQSLGSSLDDLPALWIAAPLTGLLVQPIVGHLSDRTWLGRMGRRRPYFLAGAFLAALSLVLMPLSSSLFMAAILLWMLDASLNISMEPFRAFVGDMLRKDQHTAGYAVQTAFIGAGAVVGSIFPWLLDQEGASNVAAPGHIPDTVRYSFWFGGAALFLAVLWTVLTTREYSPEELLQFGESADHPESDETLAALAARSFSSSLLWIAAGVAVLFAVLEWHLEKEMYVLGGLLIAYGVASIVAIRLAKAGNHTNILANIVGDFAGMPPIMKRLALAQFFCWSALFIMWINTTPVVARNFYMAPDPASDGYHATVDGASFPALDGQAISATPRANGLLVLAIGDHRETCHIARRDYDILVSFRGDAYTLAKPRPLDVESTAHASDIAAGHQALTAPMAGTLIKVNIAEGDTVEAQQTLVVLGAMKMEHAVTSPYPGRVLRVPHQAGDVVPGGEVLVELDTGSPPQE